MIRVAEAIEPHCRLETLVFTALRVREPLPALRAELERAADAARARFAGADLASHPLIRDVRAMYHATGTDPTKRRPSSEALLRRALQGKPLPSINSLVDCVNLFSLEALVPVGLYDLDQIHGTIECRLGRPGESYQAIGREVFHIEGRLVLGDERGPFGSPTSDSERTRVTLETRRALAAIFWPAARSETSSRLLQELVQRFCAD